jgi:hypothetical protein
VRRLLGTRQVWHKLPLPTATSLICCLPGCNHHADCKMLICLCLPRHCVVLHGLTQCASLKKNPLLSVTVLRDMCDHNFGCDNTAGVHMYIIAAYASYRLLNAERMSKIYIISARVWCPYMRYRFDVQDISFGDGGLTLAFGAPSRRCPLGQKSQRVEHSCSGLHLQAWHYLLAHQYCMLSQQDAWGSLRLCRHISPWWGGLGLIV